MLSGKRDSIQLALVQTFAQNAADIGREANLPQERLTAALLEATIIFLCAHTGFNIARIRAILTDVASPATLDVLVEFYRKLAALPPNTETN